MKLKFWDRAPLETQQVSEIETAPDVPTEVRADYTDTLIALVRERANNTAPAPSSATAALEMCAGLIGRAFAGAEVGGRRILADALTPECLQIIGRSLIRSGECLFYVETSGGMPVLLPVQAHDVNGGPMPSSWVYRLTIGGPSLTWTYNDIPAADVLHFRYAADPGTPWRGNGPIDVAYAAGRLSSETVNALANESSGPVGRTLPVPTDGGDDSVAELKADIAKARGRVALIQSGDWDNVGSARPVDGVTHRFGAEPPAALVDLNSLATREIIAACGLNTALWDGGDASGTREAWRIALFGTISPIGRMVQAELQAKLDPSIALDWVELRASDIQSRTRSLKQLVESGVPPDAAAHVAGITLPPGTVFERPEPAQPPQGDTE